MSRPPETILESLNLKSPGLDESVDIESSILEGIACSLGREGPRVALVHLPLGPRGGNLVGRPLDVFSTGFGWLGLLTLAIWLCECPLRLALVPCVLRRAVRGRHAGLPHLDGPHAGKKTRCRDTKLSEVKLTTREIYQRIFDQDIEIYSHRASRYTRTPALSSFICTNAGFPNQAAVALNAVL